MVWIFKMKSHLITALLTSLLILSSACSKKEPQAPKDPLELVKRLPENTLGFTLLDFETAGFQSYRTSPWSNQQMIDWQSLVAEKGNDLKLLNIINRSGLLSASTAENQSSAAAVAFIAPKIDTESLELGVLLKAKAGINFKERLNSLKNLFENEQISIAPKKIGTLEGFEIKPVTDPTSPASRIKQVIFVNSGDEIAIGTSATIVEKLFSKAAPPKLLEHPDFIQNWGASEASQRLAFAFIDISAIINSVKASLPKDNPTQAELNSFPVISVAANASMRESPHSELIVSLDPKNPDQKRWTSTLNGSINNQIFKLAPKNTIGYLGLNGKFLSNLKAVGLSEIPADAQKEVRERLAFVDSIQGLAIGIRQATTGNPFPDLIIALQSSDVATLFKEAKSSLGQMLLSAGLPLSDWSETDIQGYNVSYLQSPIGIGLYMAATSNFLLLCSSSQGISELLGSGLQGGELLASLPEAARTTIDAPGSFIVNYINFIEVANLIELFQSSLAMFSGGSEGISKESVAKLKGYGMMISRAAVEESSIRIESTFAMPAK